MVWYYSDSVNLDNNAEAVVLSVASAVCVGSGRARDEGLGDRWWCGRFGEVCVGGGVGVCTVHKTRCRVVPAVP